MRCVSLAYCSFSELPAAFCPRVMTTVYATGEGLRLCGPCFESFNGRPHREAV